MSGAQGSSRPDRHTRSQPWDGVTEPVQPTVVPCNRPVPHASAVAPCLGCSFPWQTFPRCPGGWAPCARCFPRICRQGPREPVLGCRSLQSSRRLREADAVLVLVVHSSKPRLGKMKLKFTKLQLKLVKLGFEPRSEPRVQIRCPHATLPARSPG